MVYIIIIIERRWNDTAFELNFTMARVPRLSFDTLVRLCCCWVSYRFV
jgi:hypothetical protein